MSELAPIGRELAWRNRRILAQRCNWPAGAVEACEEIERVFPMWHPSYRPANTIKGFERPAGLYAVRWNKSRHDQDAYGATAATLVADIESKPQRV